MPPRPAFLKNALYYWEYMLQPYLNTVFTCPRVRPTSALELGHSCLTNGVVQQSASRVRMQDQDLQFTVFMTATSDFIQVDQVQVQLYSRLQLQRRAARARRARLTNRNCIL